MDFTVTETQSFIDMSSIDATNIHIKFFNNSLFCSTLQDYLRKEYAVQSQIHSKIELDGDIRLPVNLSGLHANMKNARTFIKTLFQTMKTKIYNNENTDKKVIYWSKNIYSDSTIPIIQKIFDEHKVFTIWEKTDVLSGFYAVHYLNHSEIFHISENYIDHIINNTIAYVKDMTITNFNNIQTNYRKELDEFINEKKQQQQQLQTMAIIYCIYPSQTDLKISFFGHKSIVNNARKQLQYLLHKHKITKVDINLDSRERGYLLENCTHQLKRIEFEHEDDNVKIQIRENLFYAPAYLTTKIKQLINALVFRTATLTFQHAEHTCFLTNSESLQIKKIAQTFDCYIDKIDIENTKEIINLPTASKTTLTTSSTSKFIIQESNRFVTTRRMSTRLSVSTNEIEIHKTADVSPTTIDITIISRDAIDSKEIIDTNCDNYYLETDFNKKVLFIPWLQPTTQINHDQMETILKMSIKDFISTSFTRILNIPTNNVKRIGFLTRDWDNYSNKKQVAEQILHELKCQLEMDKFSKFNWTILLIFDENQIDMYNLFEQTIQSIKHGTDDCKQFYFPISKISIHLKTSRNHDISKCQNAINEYFRKHIITSIEIDDAFNHDIWNQHMINAFYQYCIEKCVLPKIHSIKKQTESKHYKLILIGSSSTVNEMKQRYTFMSKISKQKVKRSIQTENHAETTDRIVILCCPDDEILMNRLSVRLIDDGFLVSVSHSNQSASIVRSQWEKTDLIIVYFTQNCSKNDNYIAHIKLAKMLEKRIIPIVPTRKSIDQGSTWLDSVTTTDIYYELFREEIQFKLDEDFGLEYDKLLVELFHYTKPDEVAQMHTILSTEEMEEQQVEELLNPSNLQPCTTVEQMDERENIYEKSIETLIDRNKIPTDEITKITECLTLVIEDCRNLILPNAEQEVIERHENSESKCSSNRNQWKKQNHSIKKNAKTESNLADLTLCIERWMDKATSGAVIRGNLPPFTPTGDFNDSVHPILSFKKLPWWETNNTNTDFDHSPPNIYFQYPPLIMGSWFTHNEAYHYYQKLINKDLRLNPRMFQHCRTRRKFQQNNARIRSNNSMCRLSRTVPKVIHHSKFRTELKQDEVAWNITNDTLILNQYKRCQSKKKRKESLEKLNAWGRLVDRTLKLISDIKEGKINQDSDLLQGKIGDELKTEEEIRRIAELDDPNNKRWRIKQPRYCTREFLQTKIQNILEFQKLCETSSYL